MNVSDDVIALHSQICDVENFLGRIDGSIDRAVPVNTNTGCALDFGTEILVFLNTLGQVSIFCPLIEFGSKCEFLPFLPFSGYFDPKFLSFHARILMFQLFYQL